MSERTDPAARTWRQVQYSDYGRDGQPIPVECFQRGDAPYLSLSETEDILNALESRLRIAEQGMEAIRIIVELNEAHGQPVSEHLRAILAEWEKVKNDG